MHSDLLAFAEFVANHRSAQLHGFHRDIVTEARRVVKNAGGRLDKTGRYEANSAAARPNEKYVNGVWVHPVLNLDTDTWAFPSHAQ